MALQKTVQQSSGVNVSYWRVHSVHTEYTYTTDTTIHIRIEGYLDSAARGSECVPAVRRAVTVTNPPVWTALCGEDGRNTVSNSPTKLAYEWLKAHDTELSGAADC